MRNYDFAPLNRSTVGFDRVFDLLDSAFTASQTDEGYPPYNIAKTGETSYRIELAVAGFGPEDLSIVAQENVLTVSGSKNAPAAALFAPWLDELRRGVGDPVETLRRSSRCRH
jgi:molecular chaperone IbpA